MRRRLRTFALTVLALILALGVVQVGGYLLFAGRCRNLAFVQRFYRPEGHVCEGDEWVCILSDAGPGERRRIQGFLGRRFAHVYFDEKDIPGRYSRQVQEDSETRVVYSNGRILKIWERERTPRTRPFQRRMTHDIYDGQPSGWCRLIITDHMVWCLYRWVTITPDDWAWNHLPS